MKPALCFWIVLLTVLASSNFHVLASSIEEPQRSVMDLRLGNDTSLVPDQSIQDGEYAYERAKEDNCKIKLECATAGGSCVTEPDDCRHGRLIPDGCKGKLCQCCIKGCPEKDGFFKHFNQCFKFFDEPSIWTKAKQICEQHGLLLARPFETLELRNYLVLRYANCDDQEGDQCKYHRAQVWLDGKADGKCVRWNRGTRGCIPSDLPLWYPDSFHLGVGNCLLLNSNVYNWNKYPDAPLATADCDGYTLYPLCELAYE